MFERNKLIPLTVGSRYLNYVSGLFQPQNVVPKNAKIKNEDAISKSQRLMVNVGVIRQASAGGFHLLPLGERSLQKLTNIIDDEMAKIDAQKLLLPLLTPGDLWKITGRREEAGEELFTLKDRHDREFVLSPTHEEAITELVASIHQLSYKQLSLRLYQISHKFRDEMRPRFGLLRGKEFVMKDLYTFDDSLESAMETYNAVTKAYDNIFKRIGIKYKRVLAAAGVMGGSLSHEYIFPASIGESQICSCDSCGYATNVENDSPSGCPECGNTPLSCCTGIEVGHTFLLGTKYSRPLNAKFTTKEGESELLQMGSFGIGMTRVLAASIESLSLQDEIRWPVALAPYLVCLISPKERSKEESATHFAEDLYHKLNSMDNFKNNIIIDNRCYMTIGKRLYEAKRTGYPFVIVIGKKALESIPEFEVHNTVSEKEVSCNMNSTIEYLKKCYEELNIFS